MKPSEVLQNHRETVLQIAALIGARNVRVFGSVLHGEDTEGSSDVDLLVDVPRGTTLLDMVRLQNAIEEELGVSVDVVTALDLPTKFRDRVLKSRKLDRYEYSSIQHGRSPNNKKASVSWPFYGCGDDVGRVILLPGLGLGIHQWLAQPIFQKHICQTNGSGKPCSTVGGLGCNGQAP